MLGKPYKLVAEQGLNKYYLLEGWGSTYLATETVFEVDETEVDNVGADNFTQGLKLLKMTPALLFLFTVFSSAPVSGENDDGSPKYSFINVDMFKINLQDLVKKYNEEIGDDLAINTPDKHTNKVVSNLVKERNPILYVENIDSRMEVVYLISENNLGVLRLYAITLFKVEEKYEVVTIESYNYNVDICKKIVDGIMGTPKEKEALA